jgi:hypothetical protein
MVLSPAGLGPENDCAGEDQQQLQTTDPPSRQRGRPTTRNLQLSNSNKNLVLVPRQGLDIETDWPTDYRSNITLTLKLASASNVSDC